MTILAVKIICKPERAQEARRFFASFVPRARSEKGCVQYELFQVSENIFFFFEKWASKEDFDRHSTQPYLKEFHDRFDELLDKPNEVLFLREI